MKNWTVLDQLDFEADVKDSYFDENFCFKSGSKLYIMDSTYDNFNKGFKEEEEYEFCDPFF